MLWWWMFKDLGFDWEIWSCVIGYNFIFVVDKFIKKKKIIIELFSKYIVFDLMNSIEKDYNI